MFKTLSSEALADVYVHALHHNQNISSFHHSRKLPLLTSSQSSYLGGFCLCSQGMQKQQAISSHWALVVMVTQWF